MPSRPVFSRKEQEQQLRERVIAIFQDPSQQESPLYEVLRELFAYSEEQRVRLDKLVRISDGYHNVARSRSLSLLEQYDKQIQRLAKLARISDRYQNHLIQLNQSLKEVALRDPLTGMGNRRFLADRLTEETARVERGGKPYALAILDADHFKSINDRRGHDAGDQVLCRLAEVIQGALRDYDLSGRWGGEEFLIMLPETSRESARRICERVRSSIAAVSLPGDRGEICVSASFGLTEHRRGESYSATLSRADSALLEAKRAGRNRIVIG